MALSTQEMLLALRAPNAQWLAALVNALDEALRDPEFSQDQRNLLQQLLSAGIVPASVARAAEQRFERFEHSFDDFSPPPADLDAALAEPPPARPKLTLVVSAA